MNIHKWFSRFFLGSLADDLNMIDHCPVETSAPDWRDVKVQEASAKFGRPFAPQIHIKRRTPPSYILERINAQSRKK